MEYSNEFMVQLKDEISADEGVVLEVYKDHLGYPTVGVGHLIKHDDPEFGEGVGFKITQTRCDELFYQDINICLDECEKQLGEWSTYPDEVKLIIANMAFNLGITRLKKFKKMFAALNNGDYVAASEEGLDSRWAKQVYNRARRLMDRLRSIEV
jgi:GH24 family phage-related lysozyme (muramidase)|tara:strand:- start:146 stop:607 length:462 start_codon:yes stop_codon:yes gene_type:complete